MDATEDRSGGATGGIAAGAQDGPGRSLRGIASPWEALRARRRLYRCARDFADAFGGEASALVDHLVALRRDLADRLDHGGLRAAIDAARRIEPLIAPATDVAGIRVTPFSSRTSVRSVTAMARLQETLGRTRADTVYVTATGTTPFDRRVMAALAAGGDMPAVIATAADGRLRLPSGQRGVGIAGRIRRLSDPTRRRLLLELIRALQPRRVVVADSALMWQVMACHCRSLAERASLLAAFEHPWSDTCGREVYRHHAALDAIVVPDAGAAAHLVDRFTLTPAQAAKLRPLDGGDLLQPQPAHGSDGTPTTPAPPQRPPAPPRVVTAPDHDLSLIVTAHDETIVTGPTMRAAEAAAAHAEAAGLSVERVIVLDAATDACRAGFCRPEYAAWRLSETQEADVGRARNRAVLEARGRAIAFLDADDLFCDSWLTEGLRLLDVAAARDENVIVHPELNWFFDGTHRVVAVTPQESPIFAPEYFYYGNYYDSLCIAPREAHLAHPFVSRELDRGLAFQDWQFAVETMAAGWIHRVARDTVIFKRKRDTSLVKQSRDAGAVVRRLEPLAIDRITTLRRQGLHRGEDGHAAGGPGRPAPAPRDLVRPAR